MSTDQLDPAQLDLARAIAEEMVRLRAEGEQANSTAQLFWAIGKVITRNQEHLVFWSIWCGWRGSSHPDALVPARRIGREARRIYQLRVAGPQASFDESAPAWGVIATECLELRDVWFASREDAAAAMAADGCSDVDVDDPDGVRSFQRETCEACGGPIWESDPSDSWCYTGEDCMVMHLACVPQPGDVDDDFCDRLEEAIDAEVARVVRMIGRGGNGEGGSGEGGGAAD